MGKTLKFASREEWLEARKDGIGASEVAVVLGVSPWETPLQLWRSKKGLDAPVEENFAMKAGHYLEDAVSQFYADATGANIIKSSAPDWMIVDEDRPFLRVSPDRTYWQKDAVRNSANKCILECKTTQMEIDADHLPMHWFCQLQMNLGVAGYKHGALAWLTMGRQFGYKEIDFDPEFYAWMVEEVSQFWGHNILQNVEPNVSNAQDTLLKFPKHVTGKTIEATDEVLGWCRDLKEVKESIASLTKTKEQLEENIKMQMADAEAIVKDNKPLCTWKAPKESTKFNEKKFAAEFPQIHDTFCEPYQGARRFLIK